MLIIQNDCVGADERNEEGIFTERRRPGRISNDTWQDKMSAITAD